MFKRYKGTSSSYNGKSLPLPELDCWYHESTMLNQRNSYAKQNLKTTGFLVNLTSDLSLVILLGKNEIHLVGRLIKDLFNF